MGRPRTPIGTFGDITYVRMPGGRIRARTRYRDDDGQVRRVSATGSSNKDALRALKASLAQRPSHLSTGEVTGDSSFAKLVEIWLDDLDMTNKLAPSTRSLYERNMRQLVMPAFEHYVLREITVRKVDTFVQALATTKSYSMAKQARTVLSLALGLAVRYDAIAKNPVRDTGRLHKPPTRATSLTETQVAKIRAAARSWRRGPGFSGPPPDGQLEQIIEVMLGTSARIGEVLAIRKCDVDATSDPATVRICGTIVSPAGKPTHRQPHPKTMKSTRTVSVPRFAAEVLRDRLVKVASEDPEHLIFFTRNGTPLTTNNIRRRLRAVLEEAGIVGVSPHSFRRTVATVLDRAGGADLAAEMLGHTSSKNAMVGIGVYDVKAEFPDASGLYPKALVTYRGVKVGEVSDLKLTNTAAVATLRLDNGTKIPQNVDAELHSTSAVGEQFIDLVPKGGAKANLEEGDVLGPDRTVEMPQITPVLDSLNNLLESVPLKATTQVLDQVNEGLGSDGPQLGEFVDASGKLINEAQQQIAATTGLIQALEPVLATQQAVAPQTIAYASSLRQFTDQLANKDADLRRLLRDGAPGLSKVSATVNDLQESLPMLLDNLSVSGKVVNTYLPQLEQIFVLYPATIGRLQSAVNPRAKNGDVQLDLRAGVNDPPSCSAGYLPADDRRSPAERSVRKVDLLAHCEKAPSNPSSIRGARNLPCPNSDARGPLPASCGLRFGDAQWPRGYDAADATGRPQAVGGAEKAEDTSWQMLFLKPVGLWS